jgi:hypothetical protein
MFRIWSGKRRAIRWCTEVRLKPVATVVRLKPDTTLVGSSRRPHGPAQADTSRSQIYFMPALVAFATSVEFMSSVSMNPFVPFDS